MKDIRFVELNKEDTEFFQKFYPRHKVVGYLEYKTSDDLQSGRVVLKMKPGYKGITPYGTARDCGDHFILAQYDRFDRLDKATMEITLDVDDK